MYSYVQHHEELSLFLPRKIMQGSSGATLSCPGTKSHRWVLSKRNTEGFASVLQKISLQFVLHSNSILEEFSAILMWINFHLMIWTGPSGYLQNKHDTNVLYGNQGKTRGKYYQFYSPVTISVYTLKFFSTATRWHVLCSIGL